MARFYRTASANPIDYMYRINTPLMQNVLAANEQGVDQTLEQSAQLENLSQAFPYLSQDAKVASDITQGYSEKIDSIAEAIRNDPANWKKQGGAIRDLRNALTTDYKAGHISKIAENYGKVKKSFDYIDERVNSYNKDGKGISPASAERLKRHFLNNFSGTDYKSPSSYNSVQVFNPMDDINIEKFLSEEMDKIKSDSSKFRVTELSPGGEFFNDKEQKWEGVSNDRLANIIMGRLSDPQLLNYLRQEQTTGGMRGIIGENGNISNPFVSARTPLSKEQIAGFDAEQKRINKLAETNPGAAKTDQENLNAQKQKLMSSPSVGLDYNNPLSIPISSILSRYGWNKTEGENTLRVNALNTAREGFRNSRALAGIRESGANARQAKEHAFKFGYQEIANAHDWDKFMAGLDEKSSKTSGKGKTGKGVTSPSVIGQQFSTPFMGVGTNPQVAVSNLVETTQANANRIQSLYESRNKTNDPEIAKFLDSQIVDATLDQATLGSRSQKALDDAIKASVPKEDIDLYDNINKIKEEYHKSLGAYDFATSRGGDIAGMVGGNRMAAVINSDIAKRYKKVTDYEKRVSKKYSENLANAAKETTNGTPVIETTDLDDQYIRRMARVSPDQFKVYDPAKGNFDTDLSFENGLDPNSEDIEILGAGPSSGEGGDMVVYANINGRKRTIIPVGKASEILSEKLLSSWGKSKDPAVTDIASKLTSPYYRAVRSALTQNVRQGVPGTGNTGASVFQTVRTPTGETSIKVTPIALRDSWDSPAYNMQIKTRDGYKTIGTFSNDTDMYEALKEIFEPSTK